jgi:hypothetical protein
VNWGGISESYLKSNRLFGKAISKNSQLYLLISTILPKFALYDLTLFDTFFQGLKIGYLKKTASITC